jgi:acetylornithine deacetylase/succinyl-diaminopimelate desuccinylase-like protein
VTRPSLDVLAPAALAHATRTWDAEIVPALHDYIAIPNVSVAFDADWAAHGHMDAAVALVRDWCAARPIEGARVEVHRLPGRTPVVLVEVPPAGGGRADDTVVLYGHLDKQPEMTGWRAGLGPWTPVLEGDRLYGRGGADDGYAAFASLAAIEAVRAAGGAHTRCVVLIEASEESGSPDLPAYVEHLADRLGTPSLVVCLDSGCADYDHLWVTTSLRGLVGLTVTVELLAAGVHSGVGSGVVASSFRVLRRLLERIEDSATGELLLPALHTEIPADRLEEVRATAATLPRPVADELPRLAGVRPTTDDPVEQLLRQTWRPALSVVGASGLPPVERAGNVLRPSTGLKLSVRLPPTVDALAARDALVTALTADPPDGAHLTVHATEAAGGWNAPAFAPWLRDGLDRASQAVFGRPARMMGEGGSIPFMGMLGARFPDAQFVITGVLGPDANAHGPDEYLHLPTGRRVTAALAALLDAHATR